MMISPSNNAPLHALWASPAGKARMARQLAALLPRHDVYVEPFAGSAAVLFAKPAVGTEVLGDADADITDAFKATQKLAEKSLIQLQRADWSGDRAIFYKLRDARPEDDEGRLRRFLYLAHFSFLKHRRYFSPALQGKAVKVSKRLQEAVPRLGAVIVEHGDYQTVVHKYDGPRTVFFLDPPYAGS